MYGYDNGYAVCVLVSLSWTTQARGSAIYSNYESDIVCKAADNIIGWWYIHTNWPVTHSSKWLISDSTK